VRTRFHAVLVAAAFAAGAMTACANEFNTLRLRWRDMVTQGTNASASDPLYTAWIAQIESNARSYSNSMNTSAGRAWLWSTYSDLATDSSDITGTYSRLRAMALACTVRGSTLEGNAGLRTAVISGLDWMHTNYYCPTGAVYDNWFDFEIATPLALNDTVTLLYSNLTAAQISNYMAAVEHFAPSPNNSVITTNVTAANKVWKALVVAVRGAVVQDSNKLDLARASLGDVFPYVTTNDGFYADGSFIFHSFFPYNTGYGVEMLDLTAALMQLLAGSTWQVTDPARTNIFAWARDSFQPFLNRGAAMEMVAGRYFTRDGDGHERGHDVLGAILRAAQIAPGPEAAAFKSFVKAQVLADDYRNFVALQPPPYNVWANTVLNDTNIVAAVDAPSHRQFPGMDRVLHTGAGWTFGLAMSSSRVANYESTRGENLRGWFMADGMTYLHNADQAQYSDNFWSTVDPYAMPGTTLEFVTRTNASGDAYRSPNNQTGGASILGRYGVAAMHLNSWGSTLSARKSWFMFDNEIVCIGNSVSGGTNGAAETIVENRRLGLYGNNVFTVNGATKSSMPGWSETMGATSWAHLAGNVPGADVGYFFPGTTTVKALRETRAGAFRDINTTYGSTTRHERHYLTLYFDHGTNPSSGTYQYVLLPGMVPEAVAAYAASPDITVVQNNSIATAVRENRLGITAVNFWRDVTNILAANVAAGVSCDHKASVIFHNDGAVLDIGVADPTQTNTAGINIELTNVAATAVLEVDPGVTVAQIAPTVRLAVNTSGALGATLRARLFVAPFQTSTLSPVADAYVQNGTETNSSFGTAVTLAVKSSGASQSRESFLRFDLSGLQGALMGANLRLVPNTINEPLFHAVARVADNTWSESGITWNNKPASDAEFTRWLLGAVGAPVTPSVAALAQQALDLDGKLSLRVYSVGTPPATNGGFTSYISRENGVVTNRPQLLVTLLRQPPVVALSAPEDGMVLDAPGAFTMSAEATDADNLVATVDFYVGGMLAGQRTSAPFSVNVSGLGAGSYSCMAVATDQTGLSATSAPVSVTVYAPEPAGRGTGLTGEYYSDENLTTLVLTRTDTNVNFGWGVGVPVAGVPADHFSVRWMGRLQARHAGWHQFHTVTDEGVRLWVDGRLLIDNWTAHFQTEDTGGITLVPGRYYDVVMEYRDVTASAVARLYWTQPGVAKEVVPVTQLYPAGQGLRGTYFAGTNLTSAVMTRVDDTVNFSWGTNGPSPLVLTGAYSARWTGRVRANGAGSCAFFTWSDDAVRLWVNGQLIISNWAAHALVENSNSVVLASGQYYDVTMEFYNGTGAGTAVLLWQPPGEGKQVIPAGNLTPYRNNRAPVLDVIADRVTAVNGLVMFTNTAWDADVPGQSLTFSLDGGAPTGAVVNPLTGVFAWTPGAGTAPGPYTMTLRVVDDGDPAMTDAQSFTVTLLTNMAAAAVTFFPTSGVWRYLDTGVDLGTSWRGLSFNDSGWKTGVVSFGYGLSGEGTVLGYGANASNKFVTTYFRRTFVVPDVARVQSLGARMVRDDGAVVYLNGAEVWRENMPAGPVSFSTFAASSVTGSNQTQWVTRVLSPASLVNGTNVVAVELHQDAPATPDARFDFALTGTAFVPWPAPVGTARAGTNVWLTWPAEAGLYSLWGTTSLVPPVAWSPSGGAVWTNGAWSLSVNGSAPGGRFFRLQTQ
jgi:hyaluronate lyase